MTQTEPASAARLAAVPAPARRRVVVAMSGGVDSSVVAALMVRAGHDVIGITLQLYDHGAATGRKGACCAGQDIHDARRVAAHLGIPHYVLDYEARFRAAVIDAFADSYAKGETPIPCVACNQRIKFTDLLEAARELGGDVLATGHYVERREAGDQAALYRPVDADRDQSYFLFATTPAQLAQLWFPLGGMPKAEVRTLARELGLAVADKPDSQDICFVPQGRYADVVARLRPDARRPGDIVHVDGRVMGRHEGVIGFTVGQRRGLGLAGGDPLYVVRLDAARAEVVVGPREALLTRRLDLRDVNWIGDGAFEDAAADGLDVYARIRSSEAPRPARLVATGPETAEILLTDGVHGAAPGQACVVYAGDAPRARVLGGGFIRA